MRRRTPATLALLLALAALAPAQEQDAAPPDAAPSPDSPSVGMTGWLRDVVLPGSELEPAPADAAAPLVLRVAAVAPHGDALRYDLAYYGTEPGTYDLRAFLRRKDGSATDALPPLIVSVRSVLPPGQVRPHAPAAGRARGLGGYRALLAAAAVVWTGGLVLLVARRRRAGALAARPAAPPTLADHLRPLVERAMQGTLSVRGRAELELLLIAHWRERLGLPDAGSARTLAALRAHPQAGALLRQLEAWLHAPGDPAPVDLGALLAPYRDAPASAPASPLAARAP